MFSKLMIISDLRLLAFRLAALTALAVSGLALANLLTGQCDAGTAAQFGPMIGGWTVVLLPWLGLGGAFLLLLLSFCSGVWTVRLRVSLALLGGGVGLGLLLIQAGVLHSFCSTCYLVDASFLLAAVIDASSGARQIEPAP
jgi:hypothetical protein